MSWTDELAGTRPEVDVQDSNIYRPDPEERARELAKLALLAYEQVRDREAQELGIRVSALDKAVARYRGEEPGDDDPPALIENVEPWPDPVGGADLAEAVRRELLAHVVFPAEADADAATLWIFGTYLMDVWRLFAKVLVSSPEKKCGKSTLLEVMEAHVFRPLLFSSITGPALFRVVEALRPTLLIDEADRFMRENDALIGIVNCGHTRRTARVIRTVEVDGNHEPRAFSVWCPQVIAGIGSQADTIEDRSIRIGLRRRLQTEQVRKRPADYFERQIAARRRLLTWANDNRHRIAALDVQPPVCGNDRAQDNWEPLFRIAAVLGGSWLERVSAAYLLKEAGDGVRDEPAAVMALRDVMGCFEEHGGARQQSADLVGWLVAMEDRPWSEWKHGRPMTTSSLSRLLRQFGIRPRKIRFGTAPLMGYERGPVEDAFARYCEQPPVQTGTPEQRNGNKDLGDCVTGTLADDVPVRGAAKPLKPNGCSGVPVGGRGYEEDML